MTANIREIEGEDHLDRLLEGTNNRAMIFFKHSSTCSISENVLADMRELQAEIWLIVVQTGKNLSDRLSEITGITHQSPQAIVVRSGKAIYDASHYGIDNGAIMEILAKDGS